MGLDMYLEAEIYLNGCKWSGDELELNKRIREVFPEMYLTDNLNYIKITFEIGYWRKANHIHRWFVENVQDGIDECQDSHVKREELMKLRDLCEKVLDNPDKSEELLPTTEGFFFGSADYDEYYFDDLKHTIEVIDKALELPKGWLFYYHSSW